jgi:hypothetical protein
VHYRVCQDDEKTKPIVAPIVLERFHQCYTAFVQYRSSQLALRQQQQQQYALPYAPGAVATTLTSAYPPQPQATQPLQPRSRESSHSNIYASVQNFGAAQPMHDMSDGSHYGARMMDPMTASNMSLLTASADSTDNNAAGFRYCQGDDNMDFLDSDVSLLFLLLVVAELT